jgi:hypothetical protein
MIPRSGAPRSCIIISYFCSVLMTLIPIITINDSTDCVPLISPDAQPVRQQALCRPDFLQY